MRYVPMSPELAAGIRRYPVVLGEDRILPLEPGARSGRQRVEGSFDHLLTRAKIRDFRFHDLRHTFGSWYMMKGGDLYELAKILSHSNIMRTERDAKLGRQHIAKTGNTAREVWKLMEAKEDEYTRRNDVQRLRCALLVRSPKTSTLCPSLSC